MNIPLFKVYMPDEMTKVMGEVLHSGYVAEGEHVRNFEGLLKTKVNNENVITTNSCTHAIHLALKMAGAKHNEYVYATPMTCIASVVPVASIGAIPVWIDVDPSHGMLTAETLGNIHDTPRCRPVSAVIYVCWGGDIGPLPEVSKYCKKNDLKLIVDAAQVAVGTTYTYKGKKYTLGDGTHGDYVCFSFQAIKHLTTGDGGALTLADPDQYKRAFNLKWFGIDRDGFRTSSGEIDWTCDISEIGFKFHMNNIAGCIGTQQLSDDSFEDRMTSYIFNDVFLVNELERFFERSWTGATSSWVSTFLTDDVKGLGDFLRTKGIHTSQMHTNLDIYSGFRGLSLGERPGVKTFMEKHICLPCGWWVTPEERDFIVSSVMEFIYS